MQYIEQGQVLCPGLPVDSWMQSNIVKRRARGVVPHVSHNSGSQRPTEATSSKTFRGHQKNIGD